MKTETVRNGITKHDALKVGSAGLFVGTAVSVVAWHEVGRRLEAALYAGHSLSLFNVSQEIQAAYTPELFFHMVQKALVFASILTFATFLAVLLSQNKYLVTRDGRYGIGTMFWVGMSILLTFDVMRIVGYDGPWAPLEKVVTFTADPPYVHRVLFPLLAKALMSVAHLSVHQSFLATQLVASVLASVAMLRWTELFIRKERAFLGPVLMAILLLQTFVYYTFYDIGIVFFYAAGLALLFRGKRAWYLALLPLAVLNHENILLLVFVAMVVTFREKGWAWFSTAQLAIYAATRALQFHFLPVSRAWSTGTIWVNASYLGDHPRALVGMLTQLLLVGLAVVGARIWSPAKLWRCSILLPLLLLETLIVGQVSEARLLNPFIPIAVVMFLLSARGLARAAEKERVVETEIEMVS